MAKVKMPTGEIVDMPDNPTPAQLADLAAIQSAPPAKPQASGRNMSQQILRSLGLAARMPAQAAGSTAGMVGDALNTGINMATGSKLGMPSRAIQRGIDSILPTPETTGEHVADFVGSVAAGGIKGGVDPIARALTSKLAPAMRGSRLTERQQTLADAQRAGFLVTPNQSEAGAVGRTAERVSGTKKLTPEVIARNQNTFNELSKKVAGLPPTKELNNDTLKEAITATYDAGYKPVAQVGAMTNGGVYRRSLDKVINDFQGPSRSYQNAQRTDGAEVSELVNGYRVQRFDSADAIEAISKLREDSNAAYSASKPNLAKANRAIADAIEDSIELNLGRLAGNPATLDNFKAARTQMAKQYAIKDAVHEGSGNVNALKLAAKLQRDSKKKGGSKMTGDLLMMAKFANTVPSLAKMPAATGSPLSEGMFGALGRLATPLGMAGAATYVGMPAVAAGLAAAPAVQWGARKALTSPAGQRAIGPSLDPNILARLGRNKSVINAMPTALTQSGLYGPRNK